MKRRPHLTLVALIAAGLIGVGLLAVPGSPLQQKPTLGLDLQGGLEVTLKAVPPPNRPLQKSDLDRSVEILRDRVDRLGVAEPEIRKQGNDQIVIDLPGLKNPEQVIEILGKTAQLELFDLEANLVPPSISAQRFPVAKDSLYALLAGQQALVKDDSKTTWYLFDDKKKLRAGPVADKEKLLQSDVVEEAGEAGKLPKGWKIFGVPPETAVLECGDRRRRLPGRQRGQPDAELLLPDPLRHVRDGDRRRKVPEMTGDDLKLSGTRAGLRHEDRRADRDRCSSRTRAQTSSARSRATRRSAASSCPHAQRRPEDHAALRDRARPRDQVVALDRLGAVPERDQRHERRADHRHRRPSGGEGPRARAPDRRPARHVHDAREDRDLGDAR